MASKTTRFTNERVPVVSYPTPLTSDVMFFEARDSVIPKNQRFTYGQPHEDTVKWPHHKLCYVDPFPKDLDGTQVWWFVADRADQDAYNFEFSHADIGGTKFNSVKRTYVIPRATFSSSAPAMGSAMANTPAGKFTGSYVLAERRQVTMPQAELNALYVVEERNYVKRCTLSDISTDKTLGVGVRKTTTLYFRGESLNSTTVEALFDSPSSFWGIQSDGTEREGEQLTDNWFAVITTSSRDAALEAYRLSIPVSIDMQLPDVLQSLIITWNDDQRDSSSSSNDVFTHAVVGDFQINVSPSESASAHASASAQAEVVPSILQPTGRDIPATAHFFYMKQVGTGISEEAFITKLNSILSLALPATVQRWPSFNPVAHEIILKGQKIGVEAQVSASASVNAAVNGSSEQNLRTRSIGVSEGLDFSSTIGVVRIPPTIHPLIDLTVGGTVVASKTKTATATCSVGWDAWTAGPVSMVAGLSVLVPEVDAAVTVGTSNTSYNENDLTKNAGGRKVVSGSVVGSVYPTSLPATVPPAIPSSGLYLTDSSIKPYEVGWFQCYAEILDASDL